MAKAIRTDHVAMYIRWSTEDQGDGTTLEVQREACDLFVRSQGWQAAQELTFIDDGYSGGNLRRPAMTALRQAVTADRVDCVVVFKLDRLSRSVVDTVNLVLEEWEGRCYFKSAREPIDTATPAGKMFFYLLASYAEWERSVIRERTAGGRQQRAGQGFWACGPTPYGYTTDPHKRLVMVAAEAAVIRGIFAGYRQGQTVADLVRRLQAEGAPAPGGPGKWSKPLVRKILSNELYLGVLQYGRWRANPRHGRDATAPRLVKAGEPTVKLAGGAPAIVAEDTFRAVQRLKAERDARKTRHSGRAYSSPWLLSGIAKCAQCGSSLAARGARNGRQAFYYCLGRSLKLDCDCRMIAVTDLDAWFVAELRRVYGAAVRRRQAAAGWEQTDRGRRAELQAARDAVQAEAARLERERALLRRRFRAGEVGAALYGEFMAEIEREQSGHQQRLHVLEPALAGAGGQPSAGELAQRLRTVDVWESLGASDRKHLVFRLVQGLTVFRAPGLDRVEAEVTWRVGAGL